MLNALKVKLCSHCQPKLEAAIRKAARKAGKAGSREDKARAGRTITKAKIEASRRNLAKAREIRLSLIKKMHHEPTPT